MTIAAVCHGFAQSANATTAVATVDTSGSSGLFVGVVDDSPTTSTLTDLGSNIWTALTAKSTGSSFRVQLYYCGNPIVGSGHTFTVTSNSGNSFPSVAIQGFRGTGALSLFDVENGQATIGSFTSSQPGTEAPNFDGELLITVNADSSATTIATVDSGFTRTDGAFVSGGLAYGIQMAYLIQTSAASVNPVWSWTTNSNKGTVIASFKAQPQVFLKDIYSTRGIFPKRRDIHRPVTIPFPAQQPVVGGTTFHFLPLLGTGA